MLWPYLGDLTVGEYLDEWLAGRLKLRPSTTRSYEAHVRLYLKPALGHLRLSDVRHADVDRMFASLIADGRLTPASLRRVHATLNKAMNDAVRRNLRVFNPAGHVELPTASRTRFEVWTPTQLAEFLTATRDDRHWPLYRLAAMTGLRRGELAGLRWADLDLDVGVLHVRQQRVQIGYEVVEGPPKSKTGERSVQLDPSTVDVLRGHALAQEAERVLAGDLWQATTSSSTGRTGRRCTRSSSRGTSAGSSRGWGSRASACTTSGTPTPATGSQRGCCSRSSRSGSATRRSL